MAALSRSRRAGAGIAFIVGGALVLLGVFLALAGQDLGQWFTLFADLAIAVGFVILAVGSVANVVARVALIVGAVGWFLLGIGAFVDYPYELWVAGALAAAAGGVVGSIVLYTGKEITDRSAIAFIVTSIVSAVLLVAVIAGIGLDVFGTILSLAFGAGLIVTGVLFHRVQRGRR